VFVGSLYILQIQLIYGMWNMFEERNLFRNLKVNVRK